MLIVLLLLCGSVSAGSSEEQYYMKYGAKVTMRAESKVRSITFVNRNGSDGVTVCSRNSAVRSESRRGFFARNRYVIEDLTQSDTGRYLMMDKAQNILFTKSVEVTAHFWNVTRSPGDNLNITFNVKPSSCNIYFYTGHEYTDEFLLVRRGSLEEDYIPYCGQFEFLWPCGVASENLHESCVGRYEIRDNNDNKALVVHLDIQPSDPAPYIIGGSVAAIALLFVLCCCVKRCRRKKSAAKVDNPQTAAAAAAPALHYNMYEREPVVLRPSHMRQLPMHLPAQPSSAPSGPLIHSPPTMGLPPAYSEVVASTEQPDAPTLPLQSDPGPRFEVKGMTFPSAPPLGSDSACEVYTSEKLNSL